MGKLKIRKRLFEDDAQQSTQQSTQQTQQSQQQQGQQSAPQQQSTQQSNQQAQQPQQQQQQNKNSAEKIAPKLQKFMENLQKNYIELIIKQINEDIPEFKEDNEKAKDALTAWNAYKQQPSAEALTKFFDELKKFAEASDNAGNEQQGQPSTSESFQVNLAKRMKQRLVESFLQ